MNILFKNIVNREDRVLPKIIRQGLKIYKMEIKEGRRFPHIVFKDS
jgi:hypothetical protein